MTKLFKTLSTLTLATLMATSAFASDNVEISPDAGTTREEIAAIHVLSEICPQIIGKNKNFDAGLKRVLTDLLPGVSDPVAAVKAYSQEAEFQGLIKQAREDASGATTEENREVCLGVIDW